MEAVSPMEELINRAKAAEFAERFDDMADTMKKVVAKCSHLDAQERSMFSLAFKNVVGARRASWRIISEIESMTGFSDRKQQMARLYKEKVTRELCDICSDVIGLLDEKLIPGSKKIAVAGDVDDSDALAFYFKMRGDYYRYMSEVSCGDERVKFANETKIAYESATDAAKDMKVTHPVKLGIALNFAVFFTEVMNDMAQACSVASEAFDAAIMGLDDLEEDSYKDSTLIMQLLRDYTNHGRLKFE